MTLVAELPPTSRLAALVLRTLDTSPLPTWVWERRALLLLEAACHAATIAVGPTPTARLVLAMAAAQAIRVSLLQQSARSAAARKRELSQARGVTGVELACEIRVESDAREAQLWSTLQPLVGLLLAVALAGGSMAAPASDQALLEAVVVSAVAAGARQRGIYARIAEHLGVSRAMVAAVKAGGAPLPARLQAGLKELLCDPSPLGPPRDDAAPADGAPLSLSEQIRRAVERSSGPAAVAARIRELGGTLATETISRLCSGRSPTTESLQWIADATGAPIEIGPETDLGVATPRDGAPRAAGHTPAVAWRPPGAPALAGDGPIPLLDQIAEALRAVGTQHDVAARARALGLEGELTHQPHVSRLLSGRRMPPPALVRDVAMVCWRTFILWPGCGVAGKEKST